MGMRNGFPISSPTERRLRREGRSAVMRERALALRHAGWNYAAIGEVLGVSLGRASQIIKKAERLERNPHWYDALPMRAQTFLRNIGVAVLPETEAAIAVARLSKPELLSTPNVGKDAVAALTAWLARHRLKLSPETEKGAPSRERPSDSTGPLGCGP
jgi:hypothetical protein